MDIEKPKEYELLKLDLQFFADETPPGDDTPPADDKTPPEDVTLSQVELDKKIEAEADRKLAKALEKKQVEWDAKLEEKLNEAKKDAAAYAKMSEKEKEDAEYQKRVEKLEAREREINNRELLSEIESDLKDNELPVSFASSLLLIGDNEKIKEAVTGIKEDFDEAVAQKVKESLRQDTPGVGGTGASKLGNLGKQIADMNKANNTKSQESQDLYFK